MLDPGAQAPPAMADQRAIWIASFPKSGNTWIRVFLHNLLHQLRGDADHCHSINALDELTGREPIVADRGGFHPRSGQAGGGGLAGRGRRCPLCCAGRPGARTGRTGVHKDP